jgi:type I restriction enzyme S subunit
MNWADREYAIGRGIAAIRHKQGGEYQHFLRGLIDFRLPELLAQATGSTFPNVSYDQLVGLVCDVPSEGEQRTIARILEELDGKIELNTQINKTLEAMGRAIFKHWFIDFEFPSEEGKPYRSSGRQMVYNKESGKEIPKGWKIVELGRLIKFAKGRKPKDVSRTPVKGYKPQILIETLNNENFVYANTKGMVDVLKVDPIMVMDGASSGRIEMVMRESLGPLYPR